MAQTDAVSGSDTQTGGLARRAFTIVVGLAGLAIVLQGVWAGLFIHEGHDYQQNWVEVHARGGDIAIGLAAIASIVALIKLRSRPGLVAGSIALTILLALEAFLGGLIGDSPSVTIIHFPLALALMGLAVWLPFRSARR